jgi:hypothetical protein
VHDADGHTVCDISDADDAAAVVIEFDEVAVFDVAVSGVLGLMRAGQ